MICFLLLFFQGGNPIGFQGPVPPVTDPGTLTWMYQIIVPAWILAVMPFATRLFWILAGIEFAWMGVEIMRQFRGDDHHGIAMTFTMKVLTVGFFLTLLQKGPVWMAAIVNSFEQIGKAGAAMPQLSPSLIVALGLNIAGTMMGQAAQIGSLADLLTGLGMLVAAIIIVGAFTALAIFFVIVKVQTFVAIGAGLILLGFGGSQWTRVYVERYIGYAVTAGIKLMMVYFLVGTGWALAGGWVATAQAAPNSKAGVMACLLIACGACIYAAICINCSSFVAGMMSGGPNMSHREVLGIVSAGVGAAVSTAMMATSVANLGGTAAAAIAATGPGSAGGGAPSSSPVVPPTAPPSPSSGTTGAYTAGLGGEYSA
jgi:type IV secretion system protein TrbL